MAKCNEVFEYDYTGLDNQKKLMQYCSFIDKYTNNLCHSRMKNSVVNYLFSIEDINYTEKVVFLFLYDIKSQQKYLPGVRINNKEIALMLGLSEPQVSRIIKNLITNKLIIIGKDYFGNNLIILNEDIKKWQVKSNEFQLNLIEMMRKTHASYNKSLCDEFKEYMKNIKGK